MEKTPVLKTIYTERIRISQERLEVCKSCDRFDEENSRCNECGCFMKYKTLLPWSKCPLDKWKSYTFIQKNDDLTS